MSKNFQSNETLNDFVVTQLTEIKRDWQGKTWKENNILQGFRDLHTKGGRNNRDYPVSPEILLKTSGKRSISKNDRKNK